MPKRLHPIVVVSAYLAGFGGLLAVAAPPAAYARNERVRNACLSERPLIDAAIGTVSPLPGGGIWLGSWYLPVSADRPDLVTAAKFFASIEEVPTDLLGRKWALKVAFSFEDPEGWGLPFNFNFLELSWEDASGPRSAVMDWSDQCQSTGISLFPLSTYEEEAVLKINASNIRNLRLRLWGNR